jgi:cyanate permease
MRRELRNVSRLLRGMGYALAALGLGGLLAGDSGDWWITPSWVSLAIGAALLAAGAVRRVRQRRKRTDGLPES